MGKRKDFSEFDKGQILMVRRLDQIMSKTAALVGCSRSAVVSIYQKWSKEGTVVNQRQGHGTYQGQWVGGMRHGYGIRQSVPYGMAAVIRSPLRTSINSLRSEHSNGTAGTPGTGGGISPAASRGGFVLTAHSEAELLKAKKKGLFFRRSLLSGLRLRKSESKSSLASQRSKQSSFRSEAAMSTVSSAASDVNSTISLGEAEGELLPTSTNTNDDANDDDGVDATATESYTGEWRNDKRAGCGVSRRSDGLCYQGEWLSNKRHGYGCTTFPDGTKEEGKYKHNALVSGKRKNLIPLRASKIREKVDRAIEGAEKAAEIAKQKAEIASSREVPPLLFQSRTPLHMMVQWRTPLDILFGGGHPLFIRPDGSLVPPPCQLRTPLHDGVPWRTPLGNPGWTTSADHFWGFPSGQLGVLQEPHRRGGIMSGITGTVPCQTTEGGAGSDETAAGKIYLDSSNVRRKDTKAMPPSLRLTETEATPSSLRLTETEAMPPSLRLSDTETTPPSVLLTDTEATPPSVLLTGAEAMPPSVLLTDTEATPPLVLLTDTEAMPPSLRLTETEATPPSLQLTDTEATPPSLTLTDTETSVLLTDTEATPPSVLLTDTEATSPLVLLTDTEVMPFLMTAHARGKAEAAMMAAQKAQEECRLARIAAKEFSPSFQHRGNGVECERPKPQPSSDNDVEMMSSETPDSTELYMKGSTPPELTPDASPGPSPTSKPRARPKNARFLRQSAVDDERGGASEIQVLVEGRSHGRPSAGSGLGEEYLRTANTNGHRHSSSNHKASSREHGSSNHKPSSREKWAEWTSHRTQTRLLEQDEEKLSNYEMEMKPLQPMDSNSQKPYGQGEERHRGKNRGKNRDRERDRDREKERDREREDATRPGVESVQKLDSLRVGQKLEARPLRRDLMLSPPQKSSPIALEHNNEKHTQLKANSI
ncbi:hypothetical protein QTP86_006947 [Hemibagrus guttatus]|nr:hypothetical protein QTP86_006947 [Hemibagrus guttatus]